MYRNQILLLCIYLRLRRLASHVELLFLMCLSSNAIHTLLVIIFVFIVVFFCVGGAKLPRWSRPSPKGKGPTQRHYTERSDRGEVADHV